MASVGNEMAAHTTSCVRGNALVLAISTKEIRDHKVARALGDEMTDTMTRYDGSQVVLDLANVEFIGSIGLLALLGLRRQVSEKKGRIVVCNLRGVVRDMFVACRLINPKDPQSATFETEDTVEQALARLAA
jgi:anti-anti-sigma factor